MLETPELNAVLQVDVTVSEQRGRIPSLDRLPVLFAMQPRMGLAFSAVRVHTTGHIEHLINQHPQILLLRTAPNPFSAQPVLVLGSSLIQVQNLPLGLVELHEDRTDPPLHPAQVPLDLSLPSSV